MKSNEAVEKLISGHVGALGFEFVGLEFFPRGSDMLLRIYADKEGGITLDECASIARELKTLVAVENPINMPYTLEVSSPGLDRPLFKLADYEKFIGAAVKIKLTHPVETRTTLKGTIEAVSERVVALITEDAKIDIDFDNIRSGRLIPNIKFDRLKQ